MNTITERFLPILVSTLAAAAVCQSVIAQNPARVGSWPGYSRRGLYGVAVSGNYVYAAGSHGGMQIIDVSDLAQPVPVGGYNPNGDLSYPLATADNVAVSGDFAYVVFGQLAGRRGLHVVDVSNPLQPLGKSKLYNGIVCVDVTVAEGLAFVAAEAAGLLIADVSNPAAAVAMGVFNTAGYAKGVAVSGHFAYVADGTAGLQIIDVSDPKAPVRVGGLDTRGEASDVAIAGSYAYVADRDGGLQIFDVSDPAAPVNVGGATTTGSANGVAVSGALAYVAASTAGLLVFDVSDPAAPVRVGRIGTPERFEPNIPAGVIGAGNVAISGNHAFVAHAGDAGIDIINVTNPASPHRTAYHGLAATGDVTMAGGDLYVADRTALEILDVTNPTAPKRRGRINESAREVTVAFGHAYVIPDYADGFSVIDVRDPSRPELLGRHATTTGFSSITIHGRHAYAVSYTDAAGLQIYNLANPAEPALAGVYNPAGGVRSVAVSGSHAFVGAQRALHVVDVSNPAAPVRIGQLNTGANILELFLLDPQHACIVEDTALRIVDVSNPASPLGVSRLAFPIPIDSAAAAGNYILVSPSYYDGFRVVDVSDLTRPTTKWTLPTPANSGFYPRHIAVWGEYAYLATGYFGVAFVRIPALAAPQLGMERSDNGMRLSWPLSASSWVLQETGAPESPEGWSPVPPPYGEDATSRFFNVPIQGDRRYFRLVRP